MRFTDPDNVLQSIVNHGLIPEDHVEGVRERVEENPETLDTDQDTIVELINEGILNYEQIRDLLATDFSMEVVSLPEMDLPPELIETLKVRDESSGQSLAERYNAFPVYMDGSDLYVALCDPMNMEATDDLGQFVGMEIYPYLVAADELESFLDRHYKDGSHMTPDGSEGQGLSGLEESSLELGSAELNLDNLGDEDAGPIVKYVQTLISDAVNIGSSDIHLEPLEKRFRIRFGIATLVEAIKIGEYARSIVRNTVHPDGFICEGIHQLKKSFEIARRWPLKINRQVNIGQTILYHPLVFRPIIFLVVHRKVHYRFDAQ